MIVGSGVDIIDMRRIQKVWDKYGNRFLDRIFTPYEQNYCLKKNNQKLHPCDQTTLAGNSFAKIFAAKEATLKAIGDTTQIAWHDIEVRHEPSGRPTLIVMGQALQNLHLIIHNTFPFYNTQQKIPPIFTHISLSDDIPYGIAHVILEI